MRHWFTRPDMALAHTTIKRFEPSHWTVDFPRGSMACVVSKPGADELTSHVTFARKNDLIGLIYDSDDRGSHAAHRRVGARDYSRSTLRFRWKSVGLMPLDAVNGPTLTIEGTDADGHERSWFVRLWNYAEGEAEDAVITLPFDALDAGYTLPLEADRVDPTRIRRMFISLVPPQFDNSSDSRFTQPIEASVTLSEISCSGSGSVVRMNDGFVPEHRYRICTAYDDLYNWTPERAIDCIERLGYRKLINHYVGMSHYPALSGAGLADPERPLCLPARRWHESFAEIAAARGYDVIWSVSFELLDTLCPEAWKQRAYDGTPAHTGYSPPSTLLSPAVQPAMTYLSKVAVAFVGIGVAAGMAPKLQMGEPWWWVDSSQGLSIYDEVASAQWEAHEPIRDVRAISGESVERTLDKAGQVLAAATATIVGAAREVYADLEALLLPYLPSILRDDAPELRRANLPTAWSSPAFDVLQLEDYEWVTEGRVRRSRDGLAEAGRLLNYPVERRHYLAGFVPTPADRGSWQAVLNAAQRQEREGYAEVFVWALPQILRDSVTIFAGDEEVEAFCNATFPFDIGPEAFVEPKFSTAVTTSASGHEFRNINWEQARCSFDVGPCVRGLDELRQLLRFFRRMRGSARAFRFRDMMDYSSAGSVDDCGPNDALLGIGDGETRHFELQKRYDDGEVRRITRPVPESVRVSVGLDEKRGGWALIERGVIEFDDAPPEGAEVRAGFHFDIPVRFAEDSLRVSQSGFLAGQVLSVPLVEVKES